jgi:transposase
VTDSSLPSCEELVVLVVGLRAEVAELREENRQLRADNAQLKRRLSRNSGNSSMPSSTDDEPGKTQPKQRSKPLGGRSKGMQRGAGGGFVLVGSS